MIPRPATMAGHSFGQDKHSEVGYIPHHTRKMLHMIVFALFSGMLVMLVWALVAPTQSQYNTK